MAAPTESQLGQPVVRVGIAAFLDVQGDPLRYAIAPAPVVTPPSSLLDDPDPDFDNRTFTTLDPRFVSVTPVTHGPGGAEAVNFTVSGTLALDSAMMTAFSDPSKFRSRTAKLWLTLFGADWQPAAARGYYSGSMAVPQFRMAADEQTITVVAESHLAIIGSGAPMRTLLSQKLYDAGDESAAATLGTAGSTDALGIYDYGGFGGGAVAFRGDFPTQAF